MTPQLYKEVERRLYVCDKNLNTDTRRKRGRKITHESSLKSNESLEPELKRIQQISPVVASTREAIISEVVKTWTSADKAHFQEIEQELRNLCTMAEDLKASQKAWADEIKKIFISYAESLLKNASLFSTLANNNKQRLQDLLAI